MGRPVEDGVLAATKLDLSHQEVSRITQHLEELWEGFTQDGDGNPNGCEWLPVEQVGNMMCQELGYEDMPEFEDALHGSFEHFLDCLPHVTKKTDKDRTYFQLRVDPPRAEWRPVKMTVTIASAADLWRTCLKSKVARIEIPELEFEISPDGKRHTDSIYNHMAAAIYNLGNYAQMSNSGLSEVAKHRIMDCVIALNALLDVPKPFTWVLHDPSGASEFKPMDGVEVEWLPLEGEAAGAAAGEQPQQAQPAAAGGEQ